MHVNFYNPEKAYFERFSGTYAPFVILKFSKDNDEFTLFLTDEQERMARAIAAIFNGDIDALTARISLAIPGFVEMPDGDVDSMAFAIACDLVGKDLNEALRERREAEDAA